MRILQVSSARNLGGGETHVLELVEALRGRGHDVLVAGRPSGPLTPQIKLPFLNSADIYSAFRLRQFLRTGNVDIVHAHVARDYTLVAAAAWGLRAKVVFTRHLLYPIRAHAFYRRVNGWIAPTTQILGTLSALRPRESTVIPNWVNLEKFCHRPHALHGPVNLGLLGQISPHKGHDDALATMRLLGGDYRLLIAGKGEESYVTALKLKARDLPVEFLGFVSLPEFFEMVDVLLVPSWEEPFGIVLLEAMASGLPVIATAAGGPLDIIHSGTDGILVPPRNPEALAGGVRTLTQASVRNQVIERARRRVEEEFDIRKIVPRVEAFYKRVLEQL